MADLTPDQFLEQRQRAYKICFGTPAGKEVLRDLMKFCRANESLWDPDPVKRDWLNGRREVWLRIVEHFDLGLEDLIRRYNPVLTLQPAKEA